MNSSPANLVARRDLLAALVRSELLASSAQTRLGWLWWFLDPVLQMLVYWLVVAGLLGRGGMSEAPYPIFVLAALVVWKHFASSLGGAAKVLRSREGVVKSIPFPTAVLPLAHVLAQTAYLAAGLLVVVVAARLAVPGRPLAPLLQIPLLALLQTVLVAGLALPVAAWGVLYRDVESLVPHLLRVAFYLSPGMYAASMVERLVRDHEARLAALVGWLPDALVSLYMLNPFAVLFEGVRAAAIDGRWIEPRAWLVLAVEAALAFVLGLHLYRRHDRRVLKFL